MLGTLTEPAKPCVRLLGVNAPRTNPTWPGAPFPMGGRRALVVTVRVSHPLWLEGMLLRLGGHARVLSPSGAGDSAVEVAREALDQYAALGLA